MGSAPATGRALPACFRRAAGGRAGGRMEAGGGRSRGSRALEPPLPCAGEIRQKKPVSPVESGFFHTARPARLEPRRRAAEAKPGAGSRARVGGGRGPARDRVLGPQGPSPRRPHARRCRCAPPGPSPPPPGSRVAQRARSRAGKGPPPGPPAGPRTPWFPCSTPRTSPPHSPPPRAFPVARG